MDTVNDPGSLMSLPSSFSPYGKDKREVEPSEVLLLPLFPYEKEGRERSTHCLVKVRREESSRKTF